VIAENLSIDVSTVKRIVKVYELSGSVSKKVYPAAQASRKITQPVQFFILKLLIDRPGIYLREITREILANFQLEVTESAVCKFIRKMNFTRQRLRIHAMQRDDDLRRQYCDDVSLYNAETIIFVDETGTKKIDAVRRIGYSLRGRPFKAQKLLVRGEHISVIAAISMLGVEAIKIVRGSVDGDVFYDFICENLLTKLKPFNGLNTNSVIIMDNCSVHHTKEVEDTLNDTGVLTHFLPPYSPDYNPIELAFSKVKYHIKAMESEMLVLHIDTIVTSAFASITQSDCQGWIKECKLYN
jgi:transposase